MLPHACTGRRCVPDMICTTRCGTGSGRNAPVIRGGRRRLTERPLRLLAASPVRWAQSGPNSGQQPSAGQPGWLADTAHRTPARHPTVGVNLIQDRLGAVLPHSPPSLIHGSRSAQCRLPASLPHMTQQIPIPARSADRVK